MAKLAAILFVLALILVQDYAVAGRIERDAPTANDAPTTNDAQKSIENAFAQMQELFKTAFTEENLKKLNEGFQQFGEAISAKSKQFVEDAGATFNNLKTPEKS